MSDTSLALATDIVTAYLGNHQVRSSDLPELIREVHGTLATIAGESVVRQEPAAASPRPQLMATDSDQKLACRECGMCLRTLRRHLRTAHGLTPEGYRAKYGLPEDYAMTSTVYSQIRSTLAKESGLGMKNERWPQS